jgi:hypothetical protein
VNFDGSSRVNSPDGIPYTDARIWRKVGWELFYTVSPADGGKGFIAQVSLFRVGSFSTDCVSCALVVFAAF